MKKLLSLLLLSSFLYSLGVVQGDKSYKRSETQKFDLIYPKEYKESAQEVRSYIDEIFTEYDRSFFHNLTEKPTVALASSCNQITNATATVIPNSIMTWYGAGAEGIDYFNSPSWSKTLALHETAHTYQLDSKGATSEFLHAFLGTTPVPVFVWWFPLFVAPNVLTPDFFLEGNAVFNESRFGVGGRLYGGRHRALFLSLLRSGKLNTNRLINNHDDFPFMEEKYIVGGYFFAYLAQKYGVDKVNSFFKHHAVDHFINPLNLSSTTRKMFGKDLNRLIYEFLVQWSKDASLFSVTQGEVIGKSLNYTPFGEADDEKLFFTSDLIDYPTLNIYKDGEITKIEEDFYLEKPFKIGKKYYTRASSVVNTTKQAYSLFDEDRDENVSLRDKVLQDIYQEKILYFRSDTFASTALYMDGKNLGEIHSSAMFDEDGNYYYFKQDSKRRTLYKNSSKLLTFKGFDSKIVDIEGEKVYFTAPSEYGNSLYVYEDKTLMRVGKSDDILDAKSLGGDEYLVATITAYEYEYKRVKLQKNSDFPKFWEYSFGDSKTLKSFLTQEHKALEEEEYNHISDIKFNYLYPAFTVLENGGYTGSLEASFSDPLQQNSLNMSYYTQVQRDENSTVSDRDSGGVIAYSNTRYRTSFSFLYAGFNQASVGANERDYFFESKINYPFYKDSRNTLDITLQKYYDHNSKKFAPELAIFSYKNQVSFPLSFFPNRYFELTGYGRHDNYYDDVTTGGKTTLGFSIFNKIYLSASGKLSKSEKKNMIRLDKPDHLVKDVADFTLLDIPYPIFSDEMSSYKLEGRLAVDKELYFQVFPFSLKDLTLFTYREGVTFNYKQKDIDITEDVFGSDINLLAFHRFSIPIRVSYVVNSEVPKEKRGKFFFSIFASY